jgi:hypothetical protein
LKNTLILVRNQNFEKQKNWNSKIPEPHLLLLKSMKYVKKSGHGEEWVNIKVTQHVYLATRDQQFIAKIRK